MKFATPQKDRSEDQAHMTDKLRGQLDKLGQGPKEFGFSEILYVLDVQMRKNILPRLAVGLRAKAAVGHQPELDGFAFGELLKRLSSGQEQKGDHIMLLEAVCSSLANKWMQIGHHPAFDAQVVKSKLPEALVDLAWHGKLSTISAGPFMEDYWSGERHKLSLKNYALHGFSPAPTASGRVWAAASEEHLGAGRFVIGDAFAMDEVLPGLVDKIHENARKIRPNLDICHGRDREILNVVSQRDLGIALFVVPQDQGLVIEEAEGTTAIRAVGDFWPDDVDLTTEGYLLAAPVEQIALAAGRNIEETEAALQTCLDAGSIVMLDMEEGARWRLTNDDLNLMQEFNGEGQILMAIGNGPMPAVGIMPADLVPVESPSP